MGTVNRGEKGKKEGKLREEGERDLREVEFTKE
jgi:hypothetical protein